MYYMYATIPAGNILLTGDGNSLSGIYWCVYKHCPQPQQDWIEDKTKFSVVLAQLDDYFTGKRHAFDITLKAKGTPFQKQVWEELNTIRFGEIRTYQQIANAIGSPSAVRAVAGAIGRNPLSIVVPCHRVVGSNGRLTGFAGGVESKRLLLNLEGASIDSSSGVLDL